MSLIPLLKGKLSEMNFHRYCFSLDALNQSKYTYCLDPRPGRSTWLEEWCKLCLLHQL